VVTGSDRADFLAQIPLVVGGGLVGLGYLLRQLFSARAPVRRVAVRRAA
jgi:hypothetical protein